VTTLGDVIRRQPIAELAIDLLARIKIWIAAPQRRALSAQLIVQRLRLRGGNIGTKPSPTDHDPSRSFVNSSIFIQRRI